MARSHAQDKASTYKKLNLLQTEGRAHIIQKYEKPDGMNMLSAYRCVTGIFCYVNVQHVILHLTSNRNTAAYGLRHSGRVATTVNAPTSRSVTWDYLL